MDIDESPELTVVSIPIRGPERKKGLISPDGFVPALQRALEPFGFGQTDEPGKFGLILINGLTEIDASIAFLGQPGVSHHDKDSQMVLVDQPMENPWGKLEISSRSHFDRSKALFKVVKLDPAGPAHYVVPFIGHRMNMRRTRLESVRSRPLAIHFKPGQPDSADEIFRLRGLGRLSAGGSGQDQNKPESQNGSRFSHIELSLGSLYAAVSTYVNA